MREGKALKRQRAQAVAEALAEAYPASHCALAHRSAFELLVATVLSAQTTDLAVNRVTPALFRAFPDAASLARSPPGAVERLIGSIGLWRSKARHLRMLAADLVERFEGRVPRSLDDLVLLPGVGRKTATAVIGTSFGIPAGVTVDTHMLRINRLLGLSGAKDPARMAAELESLLPAQWWTTYTHRIIDHGRLVCVARRPRCGVCPVAHLCTSAFSPKAGYQEANDLAEPASARGVSWKANPTKAVPARTTVGRDARRGPRMPAPRGTLPTGPFGAP